LKELKKKNKPAKTLGFLFPRLDRLDTDQLPFPKKCPVMLYLMVGVSPEFLWRLT
jgi:hypothetical protein